MRQKTCFAALGLLVVLILLLPGCGGGSPTSPSSPKFACPTESDTLTWTALGGYTFANAGYDDSRLVSQCGWHIYQNHVGGTGNTYEVASQNEGARMAWEYGSLKHIYVQKGWTGATKEGAKIGDSMDAFKAIYPLWERGGPDTLHLNNRTVTAEFDSARKLYRLSISR